MRNTTNVFFCSIIIFHLSINYNFHILFFIISSAENSPPKQPSQRPEHLINRIRTISVKDDGSPKLVVIRQPLGPDGSKGFDPNSRKPHIPGQLIEV